MRRLTVSDIDTAFIDEGTGEPVVLLHGMAATSDIWRYTVEALKDRYRVVAPDLPGHGRSEGRARPYGLRFYARWLDGLLDALKLGQVTLFGSSMGGAISLDYAALHPQRVRRLVMVDALGLGPDLPVGGMGHVIANLPNFAALAVTGRPDPYLFRYLRGVVMVDPEGSPREAIQTMAALNLKQGLLGFWSAWAGLRLLIRDFLTPARRRDFARTLAGIDAPTLIAWGRHDGLLPLRNAYRGVEALPGAQLAIFDDSAHVPMLEQPEAFNRRVAAFLSDDARPGPT